MSLSNDAGPLNVNFNDQNDTVDRTVTLDDFDSGREFMRLVGLAPTTIFSTTNGGGSYIVNDGSGTNIFTVLSTSALITTTINGGGGVPSAPDAFVIQADTGALLGPVALHERPGTSFMRYDDTADPASQTYTLTANTITRAGLAPVTFDNLNEVILNAANVGGNTINVPSLAAGVLDNLVVANSDTVTLGANQSLAAVQGSVAVNPSIDNMSATVVIDASADPTAGITFSNDVNFGLIINGLVPAGIEFAAAQNTTFNTRLSTGAGDKTFNLQVAPQGVALNLDAGSGTNTLDYTGYAGNVLVNLNPSIHAATGFSSISGIQNVKGASGGPAGSYNVLIGNGGNVLTGGNDRRNLLVAGASASQLFGGNDDDILIGGTTKWDTDPQWQAVFTAIMNEWTQATDYATRVDHLVNGGGLNDPYRLDPTPGTGTVHSNGGGNTLTGHGGGASERNLYFGNLALGDTTDWDAATELFFTIT
jgi:hypothetical protein